MKFIKYFFEAFLLYLSFLFIKLIGLNLSRKIFSKIFIIFGPLFKKKEIISGNLKNFKDSISESEEKKIIKDMWSNYGMTFVEYIYLSKFDKKNDHIQIKGEKILREILKKNKPVIFISGHFANFELMSMEIRKRGINLATIYRPLNNYFINPFMEYLRKRYVCKNQIKKGINGVRDSIKFIKNGFSIALMIDQRVSEGEKINFFKKPALTTTLPAQLSIKFDIPIIPVFIERTSNNDFVIEFHSSINPQSFNNKIEITNKLNEFLEKLIERKPNQWIWTHNRWK